jgi:hypothetical protein
MEEVKSSGAFLGVIDLFAVVMPGLLLVGVLQMLYPGSTIGAGFPKGDSAAWLAIFVEAYIAGQFLFLVSSKLDGFVYHRLLRRWLEDDGGLAYEIASELKSRYFDDSLGEADRLHPMNTFVWAKTVMALRAPGALVEVQRFEADSKFFRSLTVLMPILGLLVASAKPTLYGVAPVLFCASVLTGLAAWRYGERRFKSTQWAYNYMITLFGAAAPAGGTGRE